MVIGEGISETILCTVKNKSRVSYTTQNLQYCINVLNICSVLNL